MARGLTGAPRGGDNIVHKAGDCINNDNRGFKFLNRIGVVFDIFTIIFIKNKKDTMERRGLAVRAQDL